MKNAVSRFGKFLSGMVMPNIGAFIAWGFLTALFIEAGWFPNEKLASMVSPMLTYLLPILIAGQGGKMIAGDRGRVIAAIAVVGCICGSDYTMLMGAMVMGPLAGWVIKQFDKKVEGHIPAGFEMLINNFSIGILGMLLAILGYYVIGPFMTAILTVLTAGVDFLVAHSLLPLVSIFIEPAKVLFLNNAINHGIFSPIGLEQARETGESIMFLLETNPGPGLGVLLAYWLAAAVNQPLRDRIVPGAVNHLGLPLHVVEPVRVDEFVFGALPPAVLNFLFAERYKQEPQRVASIVLIGNLMSIGFVPFGLWLTLESLPA